MYSKRKELSELLTVIEEKSGKRPILYTTYRAYYELLNGYFDDYDLWIRNVYFKPGIEIRDDWKYWQYTDTAVYNFYQGSEQHIDLDVYNGNIESFLKYNGIGM